MTNDYRIANYIAVIVTKLIQEQDDFREKFVNFVPDLYADITSYKSNPNCSCRGKIVSYVEDQKNKQNVIDFTSLWISQNPGKIDLEQLANMYTPKYSFRKMEIDSTEESFQALMQQAMVEKWMFRGLTVAAVGDRREVYFY